MNKNLRILVAVSLVVTALLSAASVLLAPESFSDPEKSLQSIADARTGGRVSAFAFALSQLPFLVAVVGVAAWLHAARPTLAWIGGTIAVLGGFGHAVFGGVVMSRVVMSSDPSAYGDLAGKIDSFGPLMPFMIAGLLGTVLGLILLGVAHFRSKSAPRWIGPALWAFVLVEFIGTSFSEWASYLSVLLYVAAFSGLAASIIQGESAPARAEASHHRHGSGSSAVAPRTQ